jgi:choline dehydrogenase-like flavoprotein
MLFSSPVGKMGCCRPRRSISSAARMGTSAENSVINSYGQTHEIANLYVAGCGIFPIESSANPTFTLNALSLRGRRAACGQLGEHRG